MNALQILGGVPATQQSYSKGVEDQRAIREDEELRKLYTQAASAGPMPSGVNPMAGLMPMGELPPAPAPAPAQQVAQPAVKKDVDGKPYDQFMGPKLPAGTQQQAYQPPRQPSDLVNVKTEDMTREEFLSLPEKERQQRVAAFNAFNRTRVAAQGVDKAIGYVTSPLYDIPTTVYNAAANVTNTVTGSAPVTNFLRGAGVIGPNERLVAPLAPNMPFANAAVSDIAGLRDAAKRGFGEDVLLSSLEQTGPNEVVNYLPQTVATKEQAIAVLNEQRSGQPQLTQPTQQQAGVQTAPSTLVDQVLSTDVAATITPNAQEYIQQPLAVPRDMQRAMQAREQLQRVAQIKARYGNLQEAEQAIMALGKVDATIDYLEGMQAVNAFDTNPGLLAQVWGRTTGMEVAFQPLPNGNFNVFQNGRPVAMNTPRSSVVSSARMAFDNDFLKNQMELAKQSAEHAQTVELEKVKSLGDIQKAVAEKNLDLRNEQAKQMLLNKGFTVTNLGDGSLVLFNKNGEGLQFVPETSVGDIKVPARTQPIARQ
jgi:hypothetical protein